MKKYMVMLCFMDHSAVLWSRNLVQHIHQIKASVVFR